MKIADLVSATGASLKHGAGSIEFTGVSTDTRTIKKGEVFFALKGPNFDGHAFIKDAYRKGAIGVVVELIPSLDPSHAYNVMVVRDTLRALGHFAAHVRGNYKIPLVAVAGSAGKTTTKEMIAAILERSRPVLKSEGNMNNLVGVPKTLFKLTQTHKAVVLELGISKPREMERLGYICKPDVALITNIGRGHLLSLGSLEGVAKEKAQIFEFLAENGVKVVNLDDPWTVKIASVMKPEAAKVTFSLKEKADVTVVEMKAGFDGIDVVFGVRGQSVPVRLGSPAVCNVANAAAAIAAVLSLDVKIGDIQSALNSFVPVHGRMEVLKAGGLTVLDDTYNANPESMAAALETLKAASGRKIAVLGDMLELGDASVEAHREIGKLAAGCGVDALITVGEMSKTVAESAVAAGLKAASVHALANKADAIGALKLIVKEGDCVLVKGSRAVGLEAVVESLKAKE